MVTAQTVQGVTAADPLGTGEAEGELVHDHNAARNGDLSVYKQDTGLAVEPTDLARTSGTEPGLQFVWTDLAAQSVPLRFKSAYPAVIYHPRQNLIFLECNNLRVSHP